MARLAGIMPRVATKQLGIEVVYRQGRWADAVVAGRVWTYRGLFKALIAIG